LAHETNHDRSVLARGGGVRASSRRLERIVRQQLWIAREQLWIDRRSRWNGIEPGDRADGLATAVDPGIARHTGIFVAGADDAGDSRIAGNDPAAERIASESERNDACSL
jgi:hypothetical protein